MNDTLDRLFAVIDWRALQIVLAPVEPADRGAPGYPALNLLRCLFLGEIYDLSDPALEATISDRLSFRRFAGFSLDDEVPDYSTLWRSREALRLAGLDRAVFEEVNRQLDDKGLIMRKGTIIDATIIEAQAARPGRGRATSSVDSDARFTRKGIKVWFGYKGHMGMDEDSGIIRSQTFTPANRNDTKPADELIMGDEGAIYVDKAYDTHARRARLKGAGIKARIMFRPNKHHPKLPARKVLFNKLVSPIRSTIERLFGDMKRLRGWQRVRAYSLERNAIRFTLLCTALNLKRATILLQ